LVLVSDPVIAGGLQQNLEMGFLISGFKIHSDARSTNRTPGIIGSPFEITPFMSFLAFLGCDGSGKSAVIQGVTKRLRNDGIEVTCGHWRPMAFSVEKPGSAIQTADDPHGQIPRGRMSSVLKLGWLWLNWWLGWWRGLRAARSSGVVLFDRYHGDLLVDPRRYRYGGPGWLARLACGCMPQPDLVVFLDAAPEVLLSRKQEVSKEALEHSRALYLRLAASHPRFKVVDASKPLESVIEEVLGLIGPVPPAADDRR
jgi:thymidylate kinase